MIPSLIGWPVSLRENYPDGTATQFVIAVRTWVS